jgi:hypothetical protein
MITFCTLKLKAYALSILRKAQPLREGKEKEKQE